MRGPTWIGDLPFISAGPIPKTFPSPSARWRCTMTCASCSSARCAPCSVSMMYTMLPALIYEQPGIGVAALARLQNVLGPAVSAQGLAILATLRAPPRCAGLRHAAAARDGPGMSCHDHTTGSEKTRSSPLPSAKCAPSIGATWRICRVWHRRRAAASGAGLPAVPAGTAPGGASGNAQR